MLSRANICNSTANEAMAPCELYILNDSSAECCEEGFSLYYPVLDHFRFSTPPAVPVGQWCLQVCFSLLLMFYHLLYFQVHHFAGLECTHREIYLVLALSSGKGCVCLQSSLSEEGFPDLGMETWVGGLLLSSSHQLCMVTSLASWGVWRYSPEQMMIELLT